ncbi:uracil-DNA glycosylase family protein [Fructobacillus tropaeoli]|uniref:Uracil-DNA glycosylase (Udg4) n=1 Tax=Fructobacillus tropaeoli TaxID=709323 RepID=A0ABM9MLZ1_9LACO|nr:uracil-DNA glycosylase family protein [Fructobacillus tropaeoli]GIC69916.1 uracil-DNA glycosylase family protein [Fructobacillus tropaeoli]CAK1225721.1 Uracil-DNA glycosylase (Udg4) [Fructobacillus tropaeoli]
MTIFDEIKADPANAAYTKAGWDPIFSAPATAKVLIIGQAPGLKVQETGIMWNDASGDRLRDWLGVSKQIFYESGQIAVIPMDFYYPGKAKSGDKPPRKGIAEKWHPRLLAAMPDIQLTILVGSYAQKYYLDLPKSATLTATVKDFDRFWPKYLPIVHPSPRNNIWLKKNPWFEEEIVPDLRKRVAQLLSTKS